VARWATFINRMHDPKDNWLTVDAGNYVDRSPNTGGCTSKCAFMISSYEDLYYDVLNIGKTEVWMGLETIQGLQDSARKGTEFVSANLVDKKNGKLICKPYVIKDYGNMRVAVLGLLNEADFVAPSTIDTTRLKVTPYIEAAKKYVSSVKNSVDAVIILADIAQPAIDSLVKKVDGIDYVISPSVNQENAVKSGKTRLIGTGSSGYNGHFTVMEFNPSWKDSIAYADQNIPLDETFDETGKWSERIAAFQASPTAGTAGVPAKPASGTVPQVTPITPKAPATSNKVNG
jgi:2',3'-cyclic-nucleotide 2'-phosphodiesterase (5'-nucleotidase family)